MPSARDNQDVSSRPSIFISYSSEDRAVARTLRDALAAAGLEVWYDENELGGGDAWDQKIRRQIRDCDYFMPLISASTERRKEGYFRREWRLAAERTLDMADDVTFLLPVTIDTTSETGARVPDKFIAVQWLRLPGGQPTPALEALCRRLVGGGHPAPPALPLPRVSPRERSTAAPPLLPTRHEPLPLPPFPHIPDKGGIWQGIKLVADIFMWSLHAIWLLLRRAPRWVRLFLAIWVLFLVMARLKQLISESEPPPIEKTASQKSAQIRRALKNTSDQLAKAKREGKTSGPVDYSKLGENIARSIAANFGGDGAAGKPLAVVPFTGAATDEADAKEVSNIFTACYGKLLLARNNEVSLSPEAIVEPANQTLQARGQTLGSDFMLHARVDTTHTPHTLVVILLKVSDATEAWSGSYPLDATEPTEVADKIAEGVLSVLPGK
jgi:hypothetical protein